MCYTSNMTNLRDLLNDFAEEILLSVAELTDNVDKTKPDYMDRTKEFRKKIGLNDEAWTNKKETLIEEHITNIKNRLIG